jgi:hypothetical protein
MAQLLGEYEAAIKFLLYDNGFYYKSTNVVFKGVTGNMDQEQD